MRPWQKTEKSICSVDFNEQRSEDQRYALDKQHKIICSDDFNKQRTEDQQRVLDKEQIR